MHQRDAFRIATSNAVEASEEVCIAALIDGDKMLLNDLGGLPNVYRERSFEIHISKVIREQIS